MYLTCRAQSCLCLSSYYHKDTKCYSRNNLLPRIQGVEGSKCETDVKWRHPFNDGHLIEGFEVFLYSLQSRWSWYLEENINVGNITEHATSCKYQPGRAYIWRIRAKVSLTNPTETFNLDVDSPSIILDLYPPGKINRRMSNFSANNVYLRWAEAGQNTFLNHYVVTINGYQQQTFGSFPEIYWTRSLTPGSMYNVTIIAVSYGYSSSGPWHGTKRSEAYIDWIETDQAHEDAYSYMPYGGRDDVLRGDDVITPHLKSPTTMYVGDGSDGGFNYIVIGTNGIIGLGEEFNSITIHDINSAKMKDRRIICPFWTDLLTVDSTGDVFYKTYQRGLDSENDLFIGKANEIVRHQFGDFPDFEATWLVKVTWENMTLFGDKSQRVTFQNLLITDGQSTFTVINYIDVNLKPIKKKQITIGYQYKKAYRKNSFSNKNAAFRMSKNPGNRGARGFWIYKMTTGIPPNKEERECFEWYTQNKERDTYTNLSPILNLIECPCDSRLLRFDPRYAISRFDRTNRVLCYASMTVGRNADCCYRMHGSIDNLSTLERFLPAAGTLLEYNPFFERQLYSKSDLKPREACCRSGHCHWYYEVRPIPRCYSRSPFQPGINFGDPHILTLDGKNYTFNGFGEYTMLKIDKGSTQFHFQARTELASTANGTTINATVFSAFVAQDHTGSKVQIDMTRDKKKMIIRVNENDLTRDFENANHTFLTQNLSVRWENQTISASFLQSSIILKVSLGVRFLISETVVDNAYKGSTRGLMGYFDGDLNNEFILPNETKLDENATKTERDIFYNFGQQWLVGEDSLFSYGKGLTYKNFSHPEFEPLFLDETDKEKLDEARKRCGKNPSQACIFDFLATGDIALAESSGTEETVSKADIKLIENETPSISGNTYIHAEVGKSVDLWFNYSDDGNQRPKYNILKQPDDFFFNQTSGKAIWTPRNLTMSEISISVEDELGAESPSLDVSIVLCGGCLHEGRCDYENIISTENVRFIQAVCVCEKGYSGDRCETDADGCRNDPCPLGRECIDLTPEDEDTLGRGYNCSECPPGFMDVGSKCEDIDECGNNGANICNPASEVCENTEGSFVCNCITGYRKENNTCTDVDECDTGISGCESICQNTPGSFTCRCHPGFSLNDDDATCNRTDEAPCKDFDIHCEYTCNSTGQCICPIGYQLHENGKNCTDIDECRVQPSVCQQNCKNVNGSFLCSCSPGYTLNEDKTSCTGCEEPNYGENCSQLCQCGPGMDRCDPVSGCVCLSGWTGENCTEDFDECETDPPICGSEVCKNLEGSYQCNCKEGFQRNKTSCEDIDECSDDSLYNCPENTRCENLYGNYTCSCMKGFQSKDSVCKDVDECTSGNHDCPQLCINTVGGFNCDCEFGYDLSNDRRNCEKLVDMCKLFPELNCSYGCAVKEEADKSFKGVCFCESGFKLDQDNSTCIDINECRLPSSICEHNCTNIQGSFECGCSTGYVLQNDGRSCKVCVEGRYGEDCLKDCKCGIGSDGCDHVTGCVCKQGWEGVLCDNDIDECNSSSSPCVDTNEDCINTIGSYMCKCRAGYEKSNNACIDINECEVQSPCAHNCTNTNGGYNCTCHVGYELVDSSNCSDIDECLAYKCHNCSNSPGGFDCSCNDGYSLNVSTFSCHNIDECDEGIHNCAGNATCLDTDGGYNCTCLEGFQGNGEGCTVCEDFTFGVQCSGVCTCFRNNTGICNHVNGSCLCKNGWMGQDCSQDVNECEEKIIVCNETLNQVCFNSEGSAICECLYGGLNITDCNAPLPPLNESDGETKVKVEIAFEVEYDKEEVLTNFDGWMIHVQEKLEDFYKRSIQGFKKVFVLSIRFGSIIADHEIIANNTVSKTVKKDIANGLMNLARNEANLTFYNKSVVVKDIVLKHSNGTDDKHINSESSPCTIFDQKEYCTSGEICTDNSGVVVCVIIPAVQKDWTIYIILVGVCVPLLITMIVLLIICVCHQRKSKKDSGDIQRARTDGFSDEYCTIGSTGGIYDDYRNPSFNHNPMYDILKPSEQFRIQRPNIRMKN
ncbi:mucin-like protein [Saccostrea echinata]|uniref:mucin-like protein n=1 Tax=Saccostrea echinata TaxID=191078 RepID=UPI002A83DC61|nr:mucin-like protein [Saccostrea echinata]